MAGLVFTWALHGGGGYGFSIVGRPQAAISAKHQKQLMLFAINKKLHCLTSSHTVFSHSACKSNTIGNAIAQPCKRGVAQFVQLNIDQQASSKGKSCRSKSQGSIFLLP
jgi:hypothetical protein